MYRGKEQQHTIYWIEDFFRTEMWNLKREERASRDARRHHYESMEALKEYYYKQFEIFLEKIKENF